MGGRKGNGGAGKYFSKQGEARAFGAAVGRILGQQLGRGVRYQGGPPGTIHGIGLPKLAASVYFAKLERRGMEILGGKLVVGTDYFLNISYFIKYFIFFKYEEPYLFKHHQNFYRIPQLIRLFRQEKVPVH